MAVVGAACSSSPSTNADGGKGTGGASGSLGGSSGSVDGGHGGSFGGGDASVDRAAPPPVPVILSFSATSPTLPAGGGQDMLTWTVMNATSLSIDKGIGTVTGTSTSVNVTATTIYTLTATNANGTATAATAVSIGQNPSSGASGRYSAMVSPTDGETFVGPTTTLRFVAAGRDPTVDTNEPSEGLGGNASEVQFFVDDTSILTVDGSQAQYWMFQGFAGPVAAGAHRVWARSIFTNPDLVLDSTPSLITVTTPAAFGQTVDLTQNVVMSGSTGYSLVGTAGSRVRLNGHGYSITSNGNATGALTLQFVDAFDLGSETDNTAYGINVTTSGAVVVEDSTFGTCNNLSLSPGGTASIARNTFPSNLRMPIGQEPDSTDNSSYPSVHIGGKGTGSKVFTGNNVGAGWVEFVNTQNWVVGGDTDAESNVLIGARVGIHVQSSTGVQVRRNFSHHVYYGGWSQGNDFELEGSTPITVEHNVIYGSSWPIRGIADVFQYNLILDGGHEWMQPSPGASVHHNLFIGGDLDQGGFYIYNDPSVPNAPTVSMINNTFDGMSGSDVTTVFKMDPSTGPVSISSNVFFNIPKTPAVSIDGGPITTDYNGFFNSMQPNYSDGRAPAHDLTAKDPMFTNPSTTIFDLDESTVWTRSTTTAEILALYRTRYTPKTGSPLLGAGDPGLTSGNWMGAIGTGQSSVDRFGMP